MVWEWLVDEFVEGECGGDLVLIGGLGEVACELAGDLVERFSVSVYGQLSLCKGRYGPSAGRAGLYGIPVPLAVCEGVWVDFSPDEFHDLPVADFCRLGDGRRGGGFPVAVESGDGLPDRAEGWAGEVCFGQVEFGEVGCEEGGCDQVCFEVLDVPVEIRGWRCDGHHQFLNESGTRLASSMRSCSAWDRLLCCLLLAGPERRPSRAGASRALPRTLSLERVPLSMRSLERTLERTLEREEFSRW